MNKPRNFLNNFINPFKSNSREGEHNEEDLERIAAREQKHFPYETLVAATHNFHPNQKLGHGGFGPVYKGKLDDGRKIAVKKLSHSLNQRMREFITEAKLLTRVNHRNVVSLLGYCRHGTENLLVYEYVHNESLDKIFLNSREKLDWKRRHGIISGIARGLLYLHEGSHICIIHRDVKASNILLDDKWVPKISDFGMGRLFAEDLSYVNTRVVATNGYMAPEYVMHGYLSTEANVFSFGVLVLELISGQKNSTFNLDSDAKNLLDWAYKMHKKGKGMEIMDPTLASSAVMEQVAVCIRIGLLCSQADRQLRPTMRRVVLLLSKKPDSLGNLDEPTRPGLPGSRYRRARRPAAESSVASTGECGSHTFDSTETATTSAPLRSHRFDPNGKRPMQI